MTLQTVIKIDLVQWLWLVPLKPFRAATPITLSVARPWLFVSTAGFFLHSVLITSWWPGWCTWLERRCTIALADKTVITRSRTHDHTPNPMIAWRQRLLLHGWIRSPPFLTNTVLFISVIILPGGSRGVLLYGDQLRLCPCVFVYVRVCASGR